MTTLGDRLRDYEIWGLLGRGGMSEVYLAKHRVLAIPVILKTVSESRSRGDTLILNPSTGGYFSDATIARVFHEARVMAKIPDPRVVRALDAGMHNGAPFIIQEYVDGIDLEELDQRRRKALGVGLPLWFICHVMRDVCGALHASHQTGVIHRDVKPSNIFGAPETGVRLGDFGIAIGRSDGGAGDTSGTFGFMAPEQLRGEEAHRATDIYGAAATAFALRYGRYPYATAEEAQDPNKKPVFAVPEHPVVGYFQELLQRMLVKDIARRPSNASAFAHHFDMIARSIRTSVSETSLISIDAHTFRLGGITIRLYAGDIAAATTEGIVSSGNYEMKMRSGVGEALRLRGGDIIEQEAMKGGQQPLGSCIVTGAGTLSARVVLHAVSAWNEASCVGRAAQRVFLLADELGLKSLSIPALGTGVARVSLERCASALMTSLKWHALLGGTRLERVDLVLENEDKLRVFTAVAEEALRDEHDPPRIVDLGLPVSGHSVRGDSSTHIDVGMAGSFPRPAT